MIGLPDPERDKRGCAVLELRRPGGAQSFDEMRMFFEDARGMRRKIPDRLEAVERLPRNETLDKVSKHVPRDRFSA